MKTLKTTTLSKNPEVYKRIMGIDSSTVGVAYSLIQKGIPTATGNIRLDKIKDIKDKLVAITEELPIVLDDWKPDYIFIEMPIFVASPATARSLAFVVGTIMATALPRGYLIELVEPMKWKAWTKYVAINAKFKKEAKLILGTTESNKLFERLRKSQTQRVLEHNFPGFDASDNNISDSCAIGLYGYNLISAPVTLEVTRDIAFDQEELKRLGLTI